MSLGHTCRLLFFLAGCLTALGTEAATATTSVAATRATTFAGTTSGTEANGTEANSTGTTSSAVESTTIQTCAEPGQRCGGAYNTGPTNCCQNSTCKNINQYFSVCSMSGPSESTCSNQSMPCGFGGKDCCAGLACEKLGPYVPVKVCKVAPATPVPSGPSQPTCSTQSMPCGSPDYFGSSFGSFFGGGGSFFGGRGKDCCPGLACENVYPYSPMKVCKVAPPTPVPAPAAMSMPMPTPVVALGLLQSSPAYAGTPSTELPLIAMLALGAVATLVIFVRSRMHRAVGLDEPLIMA